MSLMSSEERDHGAVHRTGRGIPEGRDTGRGYHTGTPGGGSTGGSDRGFRQGVPTGGPYRGALPGGPTVDLVKGFLQAEEPGSSLPCIGDSEGRSPYAGDDVRKAPGDDTVSSLAH